jgi:hypothetical protein
MKRCDRRHGRVRHQRHSETSGQIGLTASLPAVPRSVLTVRRGEELVTHTIRPHTFRRVAVIA